VDPSFFVSDFESFENWDIKLSSLFRAFATILRKHYTSLTGLLTYFIIVALTLKFLVFFLEEPKCDLLNTLIIFTRVLLKCYHAISDNLA
jgi:hypothetical protein